MGDTVFIQVVKYYNEEHRYYHNLKHVIDLIDQIELSNYSRKEKSMLIITAFMHDVVYDPSSSSSNEIESVAFNTKALKTLQVTQVIIEKINEMILATVYHQSDDTMTQFFLDVDMYILSSNKNIYKNYCHQIRKEKSYVPDFIYNKKRKQFLQEVVDRPFVYLTKDYRNNFELKARKNIIHELNRL